MKLLIAIASLLAAGCATQRLSVIDVQQPEAATKPEPTSGQLATEQAFCSIDDNWYQDLFGIVHPEGDRHNRLVFSSKWETASTLRVSVGSTHQSGVHLDLTFQFDGERLVSCVTTGRWHFDFGSKPEDFNGTLENVSGIARVDTSTAHKLGCVFVVRGIVTRWKKPEEPPALLMGGFEISTGDRPEK